MVAAGLKAYKEVAEASMTTEEMIIKIWDNIAVYLNLAARDYREGRKSCFDRIAVVMKALSELIVSSLAFSEQYGETQEGYDTRLIYSYMIKRLDKIVDFSEPRSEEFFNIMDEMTRFATEIRDTFAEAVNRPGYVPISRAGQDIRAFVRALQMDGLAVSGSPWGEGAGSAPIQGE